MPSKNSPLLTGIVIFCFVCVLSLYLTASQTSAEDPSVSANPLSDAKADPLYELRIYTAAPGKIEALHERFRDHTLRLFEKHGIKSIGYWTTVENPEQPKLYYIVVYPNQVARENMLIKGIAADPEFLQVVQESEKEGKLTTKIESVLLTPTDYSQLK